MTQVTSDNPNRTGRTAVVTSTGGHRAAERPSTPEAAVATIMTTPTAVPAPLGGRATTTSVFAWLNLLGPAAMSVSAWTFGTGQRTAAGRIGMALLGVQLLAVAAACFTHLTSDVARAQDQVLTAH